MRLKLRVLSANLLRQVGRESVREMLTRSSLRRTAMRLGLVAWRAVQPAGKGWARLVRGVFAAFKPLVLPPILIGFLAPVASMVAAALSWITLTVATDRWFSQPGHLLVLAGAAVAASCAGWRWWPNRKRPAATSSALLRGLGTGVVAIGGAFLWMHYNGDLAWSRPFVVVILTAVAVVTSLWSVTGAGRSVVTGTASGLLAGAVIWAFPQPLNGIGAVLALYGALVVETVLLTRWFPKASSRGAFDHGTGDLVGLLELPSFLTRSPLSRSGRGAIPSSGVTAT
ncbi:hypothetical protein ACIRG5_20950 [Lentzea sp. NPDC102401]|uniref:hypothetical protein n=1 Tax=Lentzea sp. NPDC102401 TaxID=3364128 RepID=UPI003803555E